MATTFTISGVFMLIFTAFEKDIDGYIRDTTCPINCTCVRSSSAISVDCHGRPDIDPEQLTEQLDSLLSSNLTHGHLTSLKIVNTLLTQVPRSVCRLTTLTELHLDNNQLTRLPDNCLTNLTALTSFAASHNTIRELQNGLFDGLNNLLKLYLDRNMISSIGLSVFNGSANLTNLRMVKLASNRIETLEPWPYFVGINGKRGDRALVDLSDNDIGAFTNKLGGEMRHENNIRKYRLGEQPNWLYYGHFARMEPNNQKFILLKSFRPWHPGLDD